MNSEPSVSTEKRQVYHHVSSQAETSASGSREAPCAKKPQFESGSLQMAFCPSEEDYQVGQVLALNVIPGHGERRSASTIHARIRQLQEPRTLSCCMIVDFVDEGCSQNPVFLKLYDRRFSEGLRDDVGITPWTKDAERKYADDIQTGAARQFLHDLHTIPNFEKDTGETWDDGQCEAFLTDQAKQLFDTETSVYDTLGDIQGKLVPRLIADVHLTLSPSNTCINHTDAGDLLHIKGILLQYIEGFTLSTVQDHAPRSEWQGIVDQAVAIVLDVGDHGVLNRDVRPYNFLIQRVNKGSYKVFMIDFAIARLRGSNESERDWGGAKLTEGEESAVGLVMKKRLAREGFELRYQDSQRYWEWAGGDEDEDE